MATNQEIKDALNSYFSLGEINTLCFDLGIPYEEIKREGKMNTITSLIEYTGRTNQTGQLIAYINKARPHANLSPTVPEPIQADPFSSQPQGGNTFFFQGDYVGGDKLGGDKVGGDKISTSNTFNMSGNFSGAILNINSTLKNVNQTIGALPRADEDAKAALQQLITELQTALQQVPPNKADDAEAVAELTETLLDTANKDKPNKQLLQITGEGLKQAAANLAAVVPDVVKIAGAIVAAVLAL